MLHIARNSSGLERLNSLAAIRNPLQLPLTFGTSLILAAGGTRFFGRRRPATALMNGGREVAQNSRSQLGSPDRAGFTVIELLVTMAVISILVALIMPAVQSARESARRTMCKNHMHQIGVAAEAFHASHSRFPAAAVPSRSLQGVQMTNNLAPHVELLPFLDQAALFEQFNRQEDGSGLTQEPPSSRFNSALLPRGLEVFACPSDNVGGPRCNYRISFGTTPGLHESLPKTPKAALRGYGSFLGRQDGSFRDGKSQTAAFAEKLVGDRDPSRYTPWRDSVSFISPSPIITPDDAKTACERPVNPSPVHFSYGGMTWVLSGYSQTWYNHVLPPNSNTPDCAGGGPEGMGAHSARSLHPGGVNVLFADGSLRFISSEIDLDIWRAVGTVDGGEPVSSD